MDKNETNFVMFTLSQKFSNQQQTNNNGIWVDIDSRQSSPTSSITSSSMVNAGYDHNTHLFLRHHHHHHQQHRRQRIIR
ncbi:hypothetical protein DERF_009820 [Dermatophagoides farinae]|uniref:Uncharacterized protein n=1 Tax=Dermatophagoides farinae TaxID=6954 RepID=A0A922HVV6_DERFA|nr:hypothetical protein DERF_009820 [Dermatophagoides farinae]